MTPHIPRSRSTGLGYESPTEHNSVATLAANHLIHRLNELENAHATNNGPPPHAVSVDALLSQNEKPPRRSGVSIKDRIACFQWTWFTSTMATGGVANVLASGE